MVGEEFNNTAFLHDLISKPGYTTGQTINSLKVKRMVCPFSEHYLLNFLNAIPRY
jgi:hypothetical protein